MIWETTNISDSKTFIFLLHHIHQWYIYHGGTNRWLQILKCEAITCCTSIRKKEIAQKGMSSKSVPKPHYRRSRTFFISIIFIVKLMYFYYYVNCFGLCFFSVCDKKIWLFVVQFRKKKLIKILQKRLQKLHISHFTKNTHRNKFHSLTYLNVSLFCVVLITSKDWLLGIPFYITVIIFRRTLQIIKVPKLLSSILHMYLTGHHLEFHKKVPSGFDFPTQFFSITMFCKKYYILKVWSWSGLLFLNKTKLLK